MSRNVCFYMCKACNWSCYERWLTIDKGSRDTNTPFPRLFEKYFVIISQLTGCGRFHENEDFFDLIRTDIAKLN